MILRNPNSVEILLSQERDNLLPPCPMRNLSIPVCKSGEQMGILYPEGMPHCPYSGCVKGKALIQEEIKDTQKRIVAAKAKLVSSQNKNNKYIIAFMVGLGLGYFAL